MLERSCSETERMGTFHASRSCPCSSALCHRGGGVTDTTLYVGVRVQAGGRRYPEAAKDQTGQALGTEHPCVCPSLAPPWEERS